MKLKLKGGHKQKKTEGYNILDYITILKSENDGLKNTLNKDGSITTTGVPSVNYAKVTSGINLYDKLEDKKTYTLKQGNVQTGILYLQVDALKANGTHTYINNSQNGEVTFTVDKTTYTKYIILIQSGLTSAWGTSSKTITNTYMLYEGTDDKEFEPYTGSQASPNVDYLQEVETVGDNVQLLNNTAVTTTINGVDITVFEDKTVLLNGTATDNVNLVLEKNLLLVDGETYTLNSGNRNASSSKFGLYINQYYDKSNHIQASYNSPLKFIYNIKSKDSNNIYVYVNKGSTVENELLKPKLEKGSKATLYSPYGQGSVEVIKRNRNQLNIPEQTRLANGLTSTFKDGRYTLTGTATTNWSFLTNTKIPFLLNPGTYTISNTTGFRLEPAFHYSDTEYDKFYIDETSYTFTLTKKVHLFTLSISGWKPRDVINIEGTVNLVSGNTLEEWVAPKEETYILPIQQEMLEGDYIDNVEHHEWDKLTLTGAEAWRVESSGRFSILSTSLSVAYKKPTASSVILGNLCNSYIEKSATETWNKTQGFSIDLSGNLCVYDETYSVNSDLAGFKAMLAEKYNAGNPVVCYLKLATPIELELTKEQKAIMNGIHTYKNVTNINVSDELASIDVKYKKDLETMFNNMIKQISSSTSDTAET